MEDGGGRGGDDAMYKGITVLDLVDDPDKISVVEAVKFPEVTSWRLMPAHVNPMSDFLWTAKPPGTWVALVRYEEELISTSANIPVEIDFEMIYDMLSVHGAGLLARTGELGLIAVAVYHPENGTVPLNPGFTAHVMYDITKLGPEGLETLSEKGHDWPEGLAEPWVLHMQSAHQLDQQAHRDTYLSQVGGHGLWLLKPVAGIMYIYEVLS